MSRHRVWQSRNSAERLLPHLHLNFNWSHDAVRYGVGKGEWLLKRSNVNLSSPSLTRGAFFEQQETLREMIDARIVCKWNATRGTGSCLWTVFKVTSTAQRAPSVLRGSKSNKVKFLKYLKTNRFILEVHHRKRVILKRNSAAYELLWCLSMTLQV